MLKFLNIFFVKVSCLFVSTLFPSNLSSVVATDEVINTHKSHLEYATTWTLEYAAKVHFQKTMLRISTSDAQDEYMLIQGRQFS